MHFNARINIANVVQERVSKIRGHSAESSETFSGWVSRRYNGINRAAGSENTERSDDVQKIRESSRGRKQCRFTCSPSSWDKQVTLCVCGFDFTVNELIWKQNLMDHVLDLSFSVKQPPTFFLTPQTSEM